jgi:hypothetical protein
LTWKEVQNRGRIYYRAAGVLVTAADFGNEDSILAPDQHHPISLKNISSFQLNFVQKLGWPLAGTRAPIMPKCQCGDQSSIVIDIYLLDSTNSESLARSCKYQDTLSSLTVPTLGAGVGTAWLSSACQCRSLALEGRKEGNV